MVNMKNYVNWAILAPGRIANAMAAAMNGVKNGALKTADGSTIRLYAVASRNLERAKDFAAKWNFEKAYGSYEELYNDPVSAWFTMAPTRPTTLPFSS